MPMCQAFGCTYRPSKTSKRKFFAIPDPQKDPDRCRKWLHAIGTDKFKFSTYSFNKNRVVCEDHFEGRCFARDMQSELGLRSPKKILKADAVPTIFPHKGRPSTSRGTSERRSAAREKLEILHHLLNPPEYASSETSDSEGTIMPEPAIPAIPPYVEKTVEVSSEYSIPPKRSGLQMERRKRKRHLSSCPFAKDASTQTDHVVSTSAEVQTEVADCYDGETQVPTAVLFAPIHDLGDHSYSKDPSSILTETIMDATPPDANVSKQVTQQKHCIPSQSTTIKEKCVVFSSSSSSEDYDDPTYQPTVDDWIEQEEEREATKAEKCVHGNKLLVFEEKLDILLYSLTCSKCFGKVQNVDKSRSGTLIRAKLYCAMGHEVLVWESEPMVGKLPAGNLLVSAAILFSGSTFNKMSQFAEFLGLWFIGKSTFFTLQRDILIPVIGNAFKTKQDALLQSLQGKAVKFSGDGRCDSPGYNAKYCTYSLMDTETDKIVVSELVQVTETTSSVAMEKLGFQRSLKKLEEVNVSIDMIATDRHTGIRAFLKKEHPAIDHQFDVWHLSKNLKKKLLAKSKLKQCEAIASWIQAISNHLWWSAHTCNGDPALLVEKFSSVVYHVVNIHSWDTCEKFHRCEHEEIQDDADNETDWLELDSPAHNGLKDVVMNKRLLADIRFLNRSCHTGSLEVFHGALLKYCPKRQEFDFPGMLARTQLAIMDHNSNVGREQATVQKGNADRKGQKRFNVVYSKASKKWVAKPVYEMKQYGFVTELMLDTVALKLGNIVVVPQQYRELPKNIARVEKPNKEELVSQLKSRFGTNQ